IPEEVVVNEKTDEATVRDFLALLDREQVRVSGCNAGSADLRTDEGRELIAERIRFSKQWFDASLVISGAGQPTDDQERRTVLENLGKLGELAGALGITMALETHKGPTQNARAMLELMKDLDHPSVRLNFDTGNILYYNEGADVVAELEQVAPMVRNVHLKDSRGRFEDWYFPALGAGGAVDFARIRHVLDAVGFSGPYTIELEGIAGEPEPGLEERHRRIKTSVDHLRSCGYFE
ncbi:MAG TPA: sugar phosphate isomerase/epimerase family protein, partial [Isosphaeraceae bacterium]|nr:sugar phosphate isomerase/epimerase family protein [Isosphaeraceae bacterium]